MLDRRILTWILIRVSWIRSAFFFLRRFSLVQLRVWVSLCCFGLLSHLNFKFSSLIISSYDCFKFGLDEFKLLIIKNLNRVESNLNLSSKSTSKDGKNIDQTCSNLPPGSSTIFSIIRYTIETRIIYVYYKTKDLYITITYNETTRVNRVGIYIYISIRVKMNSVQWYQKWNPHYRWIGPLSVTGWYMVLSC